MVKRVLVVEDNAAWRQALCQLYEAILKRAGYQAEVIPASTGDDAVRLVRLAVESKRIFDLLSLDINLGRLGDTDYLDDGRDVLSKAHALKASRAVIVVTGVSRDVDIDLLITDARERINIRANLPSLLARLFPNDRSHYVPKINLDNPSEEIKSYMDGDFRTRVLTLLRSANRFCRERLGNRTGWRVSYDNEEIFVQNDKPGGMRAIGLLLQKPNPPVDFVYSHLFMSEGSGVELAKAADFDSPFDNFSEQTIEISDPQKDKECIRRLEKLDKEARELLETLKYARENPISNGREIEDLEEQVDVLTQEREFILQDGYSYNSTKKRYVPFRNTFSRSDKKAIDLYKKRIKRAIERIGNLHEKCGKHLSQHISVKGNRVAYLPREPIDWDVTIN